MGFAQGKAGPEASSRGKCPTACQAPSVNLPFSPETKGTCLLFHFKFLFLKKYLNVSLLY